MTWQRGYVTVAPGIQVETIPLVEALRRHRGRKTLGQLIIDRGYSPADPVTYNAFHYLCRTYQIAVRARASVDPEDRLRTLAVRAGDRRASHQADMLAEQTMREVRAAIEESATTAPFKGTRSGARRS